MLLLSGWLEDFVIKRKEICMDNNKFLTDDYYCKDAIQLKKDILTFIYKVKML